LRGNAQQLFEKYTALAHDANAAGERISAEAFTQFADHYYRIHQSILQTAEQQRKAHDERQQSRRRDQNGTSENASENASENEGDNTSENPSEVPADERSDASTSDALSDEEAAAGVKKMVAAGQPHKARASKKPKEAQEDVADENDGPSDTSEAVA
jgi:rubrerythrin